MPVTAWRRFARVWLTVRYSLNMIPPTIYIFVRRGISWVTEPLPGPVSGSISPIRLSVEIVRCYPNAPGRRTRSE
jgi:hypothetical protein